MSRETRSSWRASLFVLAVGLTGSVAIAAQPRSGRPVAAMFPPWWTVPQIYGAVAAADGYILHGGGWPNVVVATSPTPTALFAHRLRANGAWLLLDPLGLGPCASPSPAQPS